VLPLAIPHTAEAEHSRGGRKSLAECTGFLQEEKGDDALAFSIHNGCSIPVNCAVSWTVVCAPDAKKRRSTHPNSTKLAIAEGATAATEASAGVCGDDGWAINDISWSCEPDKS
jgi:hypothetical protein